MKKLLVLLVSCFIAGQLVACSSEEINSISTDSKIMEIAPISDNIDNIEEVSENSVDDEDTNKNIVFNLKKDLKEVSYSDVTEEQWYKWRDSCFYEAVERGYEFMSDFDSLEMTYKENESDYNGTSFGKLNQFYLYQEGNFEKCQCITYKFNSSEWGYDVNTGNIYNLNETKEMFDYKLSSLLEESGFKAINSVSYESSDIDFLVVNPEEIRSHSTTGI